MDNGSASELDRLAVCAPSAVYPHARRHLAADGKRGVVVHAYLEAVPNVGEKEALALAPEAYRAELALVDTSEPWFDKTKFLAEVAFAFDVVTGKARVIGQGLKRQYGEVGPNEVVGTADVVGIADDAVVVPDFKSGHADFEPREMRQLLFLSLAAARFYEKERALSGVIHVREDGSLYFQRVEFSGFDLDAFELELGDIVARVAAAKAAHARGETLVPVEGEHCRYCPAFDSCPAKMTLVRAFAVAPEALELGKIEEATDEQLALAHDRVMALEKIVERVKDSIKLRARQRPIVFASGQVLAESPVEMLRADVAALVLEGLHGPEVAAAATETRNVITKASIDKALKRLVLKPGLKITTLNDEALEAMRAADGVVVRLDVKKRKAKPGELEASAAPLPVDDAKGTLEAMLEEGVRQNEEAKAKEAT